MADIEIQRVGRRQASIPIVGTAPLIVHKFSQKALQQMLDTQQGKKKAKEIRDPDAEYQAAAHRLDDGRYGFPSSGFKAAMVGGARYFNDKKLSMTLLKQAIFITGEGTDLLVPLEGPEPKMREDFVRVGVSGTDLRYRPQFDDWRALLNVIYIPTLLSLDSVVALLDAGGLGGIGDWRPSAKHSATGVFGTFEVDASQDIKDIAL
jgi:hypothetical protein